MVKKVAVQRLFNIVFQACHLLNMLKSSRIAHMLKLPILIPLMGCLGTAMMAQNYSIQFMGQGVLAPDADRIKIKIDEVANSNPGPPADIGAEDFTIDFWMKAKAEDNTTPPVICGDNIHWIFGNIVIDRDRFNQDRKYGLSVAGGYIVFGISGDGTGNLTICSSSQVLDNQWHHIAVQRRRSDGMMWLFVDGDLEGQADGPDGDVSYPDNGIPCNTCCGGADCNFSDPYIVLGAEKHDAGAQFPSYKGHMDELRISNVLRYTENFTPASGNYCTDLHTRALYHFDEGSGDLITDSSKASGGPSNGQVKYGGSPEGPVWKLDSPLDCKNASINTWSAQTAGSWSAQASFWSTNQIPSRCDSVVIPNNAQLYISGGAMGLAATLDLSLGTVFEVKLGAILEVGCSK